MTRVDDMGTVIPLPRSVERVVCLVPSLTESIALTHRHLLVAATDWCTHPADLDVARIRGTKNPDCRAIIELRPDLVVANKEENREIDVRRLRDAGVPVWVTEIETVSRAFTSLHRLFTDALGVEVPSWVSEARETWSAPAAGPDARVAIAIWRDPWMVVGRSTFTGDLVAHLGLTNHFAGDHERYPAVGLDLLDSADIDLVMLPDEPYAFSAGDGPESITRTRSALVSGRLLTWYGPSLLQAREELTATIRGALAQP